MVASKTRIKWTEEERQTLLVRGREVQLEEPGISVRTLIDRAQDALPEDRRRSGAKNEPPYRLDWFVRGLNGQTTGEPPPTLAQVPGVRTGRVHWSTEELEAILARAREIRDTTGLENGRCLIDRAQHDVLPRDRWRDKASMQGRRVNWLLLKIAEFPPLRATATERDRAEKIRQALVEYAFPPREPAPLDPVEAARCLGTRDVLTVLGERLFSGLATLVDCLDDLKRQQAEQTDLLYEFLEKQAGRPEAHAPSDIQSTVPGRNGHHEPPRRSPDKPRVCLIGGSAEWGRDIVRALAGVADVTHEPNSDLARAKGFRSYDLVFVTPIAGHTATARAKKELGHQKVLYLPHTGAAKIIEEIRKILARSTLRLPCAPVAR
jgi:hypothetical protein